MPDGLLPRGVYRAPVLSPNGNLLLLSVDYGHRLVARREVFPNEDVYLILDKMYADLDAIDPEHARRKEPRPKPGALVAAMAALLAG